MTELFKQRGDYDCALCCVAMAWGELPEKIFKPEQFALAEEKKSTSPSDLLVGLGMKQGEHFHTVYVGSMGSKGNLMDLIDGRKAILQVQSLNNPPPAMHIVYFDGAELHDPSNKQVYHWLRQCASSVQHITVFSADAEDILNRTATHGVRANSETCGGTSNKGGA